MPQEIEKHYKEILKQYIQDQNEKDLYSGQKFSRQFIEKEISPEEVIGIHKASLKELFPEASDKLWHSFDFLIEMMIHYGLALQEHQSLIRKQEEMEMEMKIAAQVQNTLLKTKVPNFPCLDIGFLTIPAKQMSGDYIYFLNDDPNNASVAVADVIGKGIPAALCMSMIKYGMDSMQYESASPGIVLEIVNRIVEDSIDDSMFISMFYGMYNAENSAFSYASAGHEPALLYRAAEGEFVELDADGLLLGIDRAVHYEERSVQLEKGDFVAIMTDGVTETRTESGFIDEGLIRDLLESVKDKPAQEMADTVYQHLGELQNFQLHDDFTIVIFKKEDK
ncbi:PP2C family protein-serine/threonine phosphatase [Sporosarcina pasteurii]|uniref:Phosphoserine phosphatase rsbU n=1 Tax=Sporosarcina pasteurii TaxID=1474 RepID=A0A380CJ94_SPOPA|nr:PP2C family protein-serine/threonine phosphatase [Sporosarcina pasteurii]MDS9472185.1 PP2C family protein-serine/threonine phosphatase [Sporosarcina pasteurii]QBQ06895.1 phosphoserine phosphatase [Sporosarcina pasteurii]SUJ20211.1 Phosphoserine phosphatase rsbU [Sporosarcina pasteurii]